MKSVKIMKIGYVKLQRRLIQKTGNGDTVIQNSLNYILNYILNYNNIYIVAIIIIINGS